MRLSKGKKQVVLGTSFVAAGSLIAASMMGASAVAPAAQQAEPSNTTRAQLEPLNNSGVKGNADVVVNRRNIRVDLDARRLLKDMPHAQHIHFGAKARNECPTVRDDDNADHRINTVEGQPAYGPVRVSLTTKGDTSPKSTLAVNRFPAAGDGKVHYNRKGIDVSKRVARAIRNGNAVVVVHGIDYNGNGKYDFGAGRSELDPSLPAEATDPVTCGVLEPVTAEEPNDPPLPLPLGNGQQQDGHSHRH